MRRASVWFALVLAAGGGIGLLLGPGCTTATETVEGGTDGGAADGGASSDGASDGSALDALLPDATDDASDGSALDALLPDATDDASDGATGSYTTLVTGEIEPDALAVDATGIYFHALLDIKRAPLVGGASTRLAAGYSGAIAVDGTNVYWTDSSGSLFSIPTGGGAVTTWATGAGVTAPGLALDLTDAYFVGHTRDLVSRAPLGVGAAVPFVPGPCPGPLALDATHVYMIRMCVGTVEAAPKAGGASTTLMTGVGRSKIAVAGGYVYVGGAGVRRVPVGGGAVETLVPATTNVSALATDGAQVYYATFTALRKVPAAGGADVLIASGLVNVADMALYGTRVYFTFMGTGGIGAVSRF